MTLAVMMRATMGHTGRPLAAGAALTGAFVAICAASLARAAGAGVTAGGFDGIDLSALLWTLAFGIFLGKVAPWLWSPKAGPKTAARNRTGSNA